MLVRDYQLVIVLLAAGKSERFGDIKQLANASPLTDSPTVLEQTASRLLPLSENLVIATGHYHHAIKSALNTAYRIYQCPNADSGMGHTIADATSFVLQQFPNCSHLMFALADQVALQSEHYMQMLSHSLRFKQHIICAESAIGISPPAIFPKWSFEQLQQLEGDKGAKRILKRYQEQTIKVDIDEAEIDIDTPEDLFSWHNNTNKDPHREQA